MRDYEVMVIFDPDADQAAIDGVVSRATSLLAERGGEVESSETWGKRKLAYEIDHRSEGIYVLVKFRAEPGDLTELERVLTLADQVLRHKVVKRAA
ncbi:MAG TPA: 30S ribosomal protein S6 [Actinomycetota bacterium]|nr:30S ribosomal protein S6 [Actinomycetota bacterium]